MPCVSPALTTRLGQGAILAGAVNAFARLGFDDTRVEDILEAAGVARRTFYKYFSSKEDVLAAVYEIATSELLRAIRSVEAQDEKPLDSIHRGVDVYLDYHVENAALVRVLLTQAIRPGSPLGPARRRFRDDIARLIDDAVLASSGSKNDPMLYAALISALEGLSLELLAGDSASPQAVARAKSVMHQLLTRVLG